MPRSALLTASAILSAAWSGKGEGCGGECGLDLVRQCDAIGGSGRIVEDDGLLAGALGVVENEDRPELPDGSSAETGSARRLQNRFLVEIVAAENLINFAKDTVILKKRSHAIVGGSHRAANIDHVAPITRIPEMVSRRHCRRIGGRERWKYRM